MTEAVQADGVPVDRDQELRRAHQRAFAKIQQARATNDFRTNVKVAIEELVDACEAYTIRN
jgi:hypothetical protein